MWKVLTSATSLADIKIIWGKIIELLEFGVHWVLCVAGVCGNK